MANLFVHYILIKQIEHSRNTQRTNALLSSTVYIVQLHAWTYESRLQNCWLYSVVQVWQ